MTVTVESFVEGSVLHLGNSPHSMIEGIVCMTMGTGNPRIEGSRSLVAVVGGKLHGESGKRR